MSSLLSKNITPSNLEVKNYKIHFTNVENVQKIIVKNTNNVRFNAFQYTQIKNIENTASLYLSGMQNNRITLEITLTDSEYTTFTGTLNVVLKGGFYTNPNHTYINRADYTGEFSFTNGVGIQDIGQFFSSSYGSFIEQHDIPLSNIFYYVIDGVQTQWVTDLSSIGYSEVQPVVLPTVSYIDRFIYSGGGLSAGEIGTLRDSNNNTITYNTGVSYAVYWYASSNWSYGDVSYVSLVNESSLLKVKNISNTYINIYFVSTYECSSNQATVVTVYDSSNITYNAFKYTFDGIDYYYVLDGVQVNWTDNLSSIGYKLYNLEVFGSNGGNIYLGQENNWMYVFDEPNNRYILLEGGTSSTTWEIQAIYDTNGNEVSHESDYIWWINANNIYYKANPTRDVSLSRICLIVNPSLT